MIGGSTGKAELRRCLVFCRRDYLDGGNPVSRVRSEVCLCGPGLQQPDVGDRGYDGHFALSDVWSSADGVQWNRANDSAGFGDRSGLSAAVFDNRMRVIGGNQGTKLYNDTWYSADGVLWTEATAAGAFSGRAAMQVRYLTTRTWVIGGIGSRRTLNDTWYTADGINWTEATPSAAFPGRFDFPALVLNDRMWVIGGLTVTVPRREQHVVYHYVTVSGTAAYPAGKAARCHGSGYWQQLLLLPRFTPGLPCCGDLRPYLKGRRIAEKTGKRNKRSREDLPGPFFLQRCCSGLMQDETARDPSFKKPGSCVLRISTGTWCGHHSTPGGSGLP